MKHQILTAALLAAFAAAMAGCSSTPAPRTDVALSDSALQSAELAGARELAPIELRKARETRRKANKAMKDEEYVLAKRLAEQAKAEADLAQATAESVKSEQALREARDGIQLMKDELQRVKAPR